MGIFNHNDIYNKLARYYLNQHKPIANRTLVPTVKSETKYKTFHLQNFIRKYRLQNIRYALMFSYS